MHLRHCPCPSPRFNTYKSSFLILLLLPHRKISTTHFHRTVYLYPNGASRYNSINHRYQFHKLNPNHRSFISISTTHKMDTLSSEVKQQWSDKLVGKKIVDEPSEHPDHFCKQDLPQGVQSHRVIPPGTMVTKDFRPDRMNVHVDDEGVCTRVHFG
ncbi:hypothetical protein TWF730_001127 [Orbilia blumenaviensis]|uniref:Uncharacterized protein n=1 Tax=Orbilia blumenaviensis TaxID=1796055 RepID=A0AAV9VPQ9_9PEZI